MSFVVILIRVVFGIIVFVMFLSFRCSLICSFLRVRSFYEVLRNRVGVVDMFGCFFVV